MTASSSEASLLKILQDAGFSSSEISAFRKKDKMVSGTMESTNERELAAKFGCMIQTGLSDLEHLFLTSTRETDTSAFQVGSMDELDQLKLEPNRDTMALMYMKAAKSDGNDELNLSREERSLFASCKNADDVEAVLRQVLKNRYDAYRQSGLDGIAPYARKGSCMKGDTSYDPGAELKLKSQKSTLAQQHAPPLFEVLNNYPQKKPEEEAYSWVNFTIDDKPTLCLVHKFTTHSKNDRLAVCQRHFYVSRGHNSVQGVGGAFAITDKETAIVYGSRTSTDQVAGFGGSAKRAIGAKIMTGKIAKNLDLARQRWNET